MLDLAEAPATHRNKGVVVIDLDFEALADSVKEISAMLDLFQTVTVSVFKNGKPYDFTFKDGMHDGTLITDEWKKVLVDYLGAHRFQQLTTTVMKLPVAPRKDLSTKDQYMLISNYFESNEIMHVTVGSPVLRGKGGWAEMAPEMIHGFVTGIHLDGNDVSCTIRFQCSEVIKNILTTSPCIIVPAYAVIDSRFERVLRMFVRPMYSAELEKE